MRSCSNPSPSQCGKNCQGSTTKIQQCNTQSCPGNKTLFKYNIVSGRGV